MRAVLAMLVVVACASPHEPTAPSAPLPLPDATQIVAATLATYRGLTSYEDRGTIETAQGERMAFRTQFAKPGLRFEVAGVVLYSAGDRVIVQSKLKAGPATEVPSLAQVLESGAKPSHGASTLVPSLIGLGDSTAISTTMRVIGSDTIGGRPCWQLAGDTSTLWIDRDSHLIRRAAFVVAGSRTRDVIDYTPGVGTITAVQPLVATAKPVADTGPPQWIGIRFDGTTTRVLDVIATGPAQRAGVKTGDLIVAIDGVPMVKSTDVTGRVRRARSSPLKIQLDRNGARVDVVATTEAMPSLDTLASSVLLGKPAPDFSLATLSNSSVKLADFATSVVVLDFWATWCRPCEMMIPHLHALQTKYGAKLSIVAISSEDRADIASYATAHGLRYTVANDTDGKVSGAYLANVLPTTIVVAKGMVRFVGTGVGDETDLDAAIAKAIASP